MLCYAIEQLQKENLAQLFLIVSVKRQPAVMNRTLNFQYPSKTETYARICEYE